MRITRTMARVFLVGFLVIALPSLSVHSTTTAPTTAPSQSPESTDAPAQTTNAAAADPTTGPPSTGSPASSPAPDATTAMEDDTTTGASDPSGVTGSTMGGGDTTTPAATTNAANAPTAAPTESTTAGPDSSGGDTTTSPAGPTAEPSTSAPEQTTVDTSDTSTAAPAMDTSTAAGSVDTATPATGSGTATEAGSTAADSGSTPAPSDTTTMGETTTTGGSSETEPTVGSPTAPAPTETSTDASTTAPSTMPPTTTTPAPSVRPGGYFVLTLPFGSSDSDVLSCSPCNTTQIKEAVKNSFQGIPGFLFIEEQAMQRRKRETTVTLRIVFDPTKLMEQLNQTQRETEFANSINNLNNQAGILVNTTLSSSLAATFGEQTSSLCKISRACPAQYRCDDATQTCVHLCAEETCSGNGQCQVEIRGDVEPKAVCMCNSDYETTYTGEKCQESETSKRKVIAILAGVLGTFCAILLLVVIVLCCRLRGGFGDSSSKYELGGRRGFTNNAYSDDVNMKKMG